MQLHKNNILFFLKTNKLYLGIILFICLNIFLSCWYVLHGDIVFHTDIARDFLVLQDIVKTGKPTLIGPRAGGIPGVFHGPLWFYINLPAFIIGKGNPVVIGWFWILLIILSTYGVYFTGRRMFNKLTGLIGALLFSTFAIIYAPALFNSYGAVALFPLYFYFFRQYIKTEQVRNLIPTLLLTGLLVQFQVGFGGIITILTLFYLIYFFIRKKKYSHLFYLPVILIPLSTFILFELRHDFFQIRAVISYITKSHSVGTDFTQHFLSRVNGFVFSTLRLTAFDNPLIRPAPILFDWILFKIISDRKMKFREEYILYFYLTIGFWLCMVAYKGIVWGFFYWSFLPVTLLMFSSAIMLINKKLFLIFFAIVYISNLQIGFQFIQGAGGNWKLYHQIARHIYSDAGKKEFGYYVFSPDLLAYSEKYALSHTQHEFPETKSYPFQKKAQTYLTLEKAPDDRPWLDGIWWIAHQVKITKKPVKEITFANGMTVKKYLLSSKEIQIRSDANLVHDLIFR